jgi:hypothetical protein
MMGAALADREDHLSADRFDSLTRTLAGDGMSRRTTLKAAALGGAAALFGRFATEKAEAASSTSTCTGTCARRNWCVNRTHTCGPTGGHAKCFVLPLGNNICAEILFQAQACSACRSPNCVNCRCILGAGGGDKCNNGASGYDYVCIRPV